MDPVADQVPVAGSKSSAVARAAPTFGGVMSLRLGPPGSAPVSDAGWYAASNVPGSTRLSLGLTLK